MSKHYDDTFLARWISGELSPEELLAFQKSKYYQDYKKINEGTKALEAPSFDRQKMLTQIEFELNNAQAGKKTVRLIPQWAYGLAAVLVVAFGLLFFLNNKPTHFETDFGEQLLVTLPDNSKVHLNAKSKLSFNEKGWGKNRELQFNGEAFFDVEKGASFKVNTNQGIVEVLGTEFNVLAFENYFEVQCHEGKVKISGLNGSELATLTQGKAFRIAKNNKEEWTFSEVKPQWIYGESSFQNTPLFQVIKAIKNQYNIDFNSDEIDTTQRFTGSFTHNDLKLALKTVFKPLDIMYSPNESNIIFLDQN